MSATGEQSTSDRPTRPAPMHRGPARDLGIEIIEGRLAADSGMTLDDIQRRFDVSRTVAREVLRELETLHLVVARRRVGIVVQQRAAWNFLHPTLIDWRLRSEDRPRQLHDLTQLRHVVEPAAAAAAADLADVETRAMLPPLAARMRTLGEAGQLEEFMELDITMHRAILASSGNELFTAMADLVEVVLVARTELSLMPQQPKPEALAAHEAVADAIWRGDAGAARDAMVAITTEVLDAFGA
ncbi:FadR/GntR family transcriptional regulator [Yimella sp. cx-51]|uniref:FadR/GntR family transcriptional regulator n=1 Tax=Yimella sp. cx-51 TaxID=2770551 RepID=UPI001FCC7242|nr:FCD domain-containing protein [Yimella sp. cx-51]